MIFFAYRFFAAPVMVCGFFLLTPFNKKIRTVFGQKLRTRFPPQLSESPIWIHAASGEFEYAKSVIRELKAIDPKTSIIVTYSSATFVKAIESFPGVDFSLPLPVDLPGPCSSFLRKYKPKCFLIARTDLWPEILHQTQARGIPRILFSYTQRPPEKMNFLARFARSWLLRQMSQILCVTESDAQNLKRLGVSATVTVGGDTRYDQVQFRLSHPKELPLALKPKRATLVAGSTWEADEDVLFEALTPALSSRRMQLILVPHEPTPEHIEALEKRLEKLNLRSKKFSSGEDWSEADVLLVDKIGVLAELYQWADIAFVGGSYKGSVHSVMEPLGAGCLTLVGPHFHNNREATEFSQIPVDAFTAVQVCTDAKSFQRTVDLILGGSREARAQEILKAFNQRLGKSRILSERILDRNPPGPASDSSNQTLRN